MTLTSDITGYFFVEGPNGIRRSIGCQGNPCDAVEKYTYQIPVPGPLPVTHTSVASVRGAVRELRGTDIYQIPVELSPNSFYFSFEFDTSQSNFDIDVKDSFLDPHVLGSGTFHLSPGTWQVRYLFGNNARPGRPNYFYLLDIPESRTDPSYYGGIYNVPTGTDSLSWRGESEAFGAEDNFTTGYLVFTNLTPSPEPSSFYLLGLLLLAFVFWKQRSV